MKKAALTTNLMLCGVAVPAGVSYALALLFLDPLYSSASLGLLGLFITCILGITSLPMLARMLTDRNLFHSPVGELVLAVAVLEDVVSYILLAIVVVLIKATSSLGILWVVLLVSAETLLLVFVARPLIRLVVAMGEATNASILQHHTFLLLSLIVILFCFITNAIGACARAHTRLPIFLPPLLPGPPVPPSPPSPPVTPIASAKRLDVHDWRLPGWPWFSKGLQAHLPTQRQAGELYPHPPYAPVLLHQWTKDRFWHG
jgi:hypothetical protein